MGARDIVLGRHRVVNLERTLCEQTGILALAKCFEDGTEVSVGRPNSDLRGRSKTFIFNRHPPLLGINGRKELLASRRDIKASGNVTA